MKRRKGFYSISVVAKMFSVHQQTIRMYEKEGLICPKRTEGNTRLFSEEDVDRLEQVINLTHKMGVNIVGVQMILKMQKKMKRMQAEMNKLFEQVQGQLDKESDEYKDLIEKQGKKLLKMKKECDKDKKSSEKKSSPIDIEQELDKHESKENFNDWEIDYENDE
ncbi:MerR family transcriptional regulator [Candidatus Dependentiae bacterium]|nr:MerR family transcriptional regulator [Candidatus Dependentiae bacterium]